MLLKIKARLTDGHYQTLRHFLSPNIDDQNETGWEEITFAGLKHLTATCLSGPGRQGQNVGTTKMQELEDTQKLKQSIQAVADRVIALSANG